MAEIVFRTGTDDGGLYHAQVGGNPSSGLYFLLGGQQAGPEEIPLPDTWKPEAGNRAGWYLFTGAEVERPDRFAAQVRVLIDRQSLGSQGFLWIPVPNTPDDLEGTAIKIRRPEFTTTDQASFKFRQVTLKVPSQLQVSLEHGDSKTASFRFHTPNGQPGRLFLFVDDAVAGTPLRPLVVTMWGAQGGGLSYGYKLDRRGLFAFGGDLRYFRTDLERGMIRQIRYPLIEIEESIDEGETEIEFDVRMDPSRLEDENRTCFAIAAASQGKRYSSYLRTVADEMVYLTPGDGAGFVFSTQLISTSEPKLNKYYLAPVGTMTINFSGSGISQAEAQTSARLMFGLSGSEFVEAREGDLLNFVAQRPAFFADESGRDRYARVGASRLLPDGTTSWISVLPAPAAGDFSYYAQPDLSVYYGGQIETGLESSDFIGAMDVNVSSLKEPGGQPAVFPAVAYAGVGLPGVNDGSQITPQDFVDFETNVLSPARQQLIPKNPQGPVFEGGAMRTGKPRALALRAGPDEAFGVTPQGLLAAINQPHGTWRELILAVSSHPELGEQRLSFLPEDVQNPTLAHALANALMSNDLFLVISVKKPAGDANTASNVGRFQSKVSIQGFTFDLALSEEAHGEIRADEIKTILIFKFRNQPMRDLVQDPANWADAATFNQQLDGQFPVRDRIREFFDVPDDDRFKNFRRVISDSQWNGILALNCALGTDALPTDLQGLRAGMPGGLIGHHLGIEISSVSTGRDIKLEKSSLFGFIAKADQPPPAARADVPQPFTFNVDRFFTSFLNSQLVGFVCDITLTLRTLFGRSVKTGSQEQAPDQVIIRGRYQKHDGLPLFIFEADDNKNFLIDQPPETIRVLTAVRFRSVRFGTDSVVRDDEKKSIAVAAGFLVNGSLTFNPGGTGTGLPFDVFGYAADHELAFGNVRLAVNFTINEHSQVRDVVYRFDPAGLVFDSAILPPQTGSLPASFPLTLTRFLYDPEGLSASKLGGQSVVSTDLLPISTLETTYGLIFTLPLGSLGALGVHVSLDARFGIGWGASPTIPDDDAIALTIQLPAITPGFRGFSLQGVLGASFGTCNLIRLDGQRFVLGFNNVGLSVMGMKLPPGYMIDFLISADPHQSSGNSNVAWLLALQKETKDQQLALEAAQPKPLAASTKGCADA